MEKYTIMIIDDEFSDRKELYQAFFCKDYDGVEVAFDIKHIEYGRDLQLELRKNSKNIDAILLDARLNDCDKGWGTEFGPSFATVIKEIENVYKDCMPPIFMISKQWATDGDLLAGVSNAFSNFQYPTAPFKYYYIKQFEALTTEASRRDSNGKFQTQSLNYERQYISDVIKKMRRGQYNSDQPIDAVLILAVPDEKKAAYQLMNLNIEHDIFFKQYGFLYQKTQIGKKQVVIIPQAQMGMTDAAKISTAAILAFRPKIIAMTGICAGKRDKVRIGDIIAADSTLDYSVAKINVSDYETRARHQSAPNSVLNFIKNTLINKQELIFASLNDKYQGGDIPKTRSKIHCGAMASGTWVVNNPEIFKEINSRIGNNCISIDMEAYAIASVATSYDIPWLVIKSVQDYGDGNKGEDEKASRNYAAFSSSYIFKNYIEELIDRYIVGE